MLFTTLHTVCNTTFINGTCKTHLKSLLCTSKVHQISHNKKISIKPWYDDEIKGSLKWGSRVTISYGHCISVTGSWAFSCGRNISVTGFWAYIHYPVAPPRHLTRASTYTFKSSLHIDISPISSMPYSMGSVRETMTSRPYLKTAIFHFRVTSSGKYIHVIFDLAERLILSLFNFSWIPSTEWIFHELFKFLVAAVHLLGEHMNIINLQPSQDNTAMLHNVAKSNVLLVSVT